MRARMARAYRCAPPGATAGRDPPNLGIFPLLGRPHPSRLMANPGGGLVTRPRLSHLVTMAVTAAAEAGHRRIPVRRTTQAALLLAATVTMMAAFAGVAAGPAAATTYPPPSVHLQCTQAPTDGALHGSVCALGSGQTTVPNNYSATIAANKVGLPTSPVIFTLTAGSLPPGLTMSTQSATSVVIAGNLARAGTFNFTVKANVGSHVSTLTY